MTDGKRNAISRKLRAAGTSLGYVLEDLRQAHPNIATEQAVKIEQARTFFRQGYALISGLLKGGKK